MKTIMLQAASQRGILTEERLQAALKPGADLHQAQAGLTSLQPPSWVHCFTRGQADSRRAASWIWIVLWAPRRFSGLIKACARPPA